MVLSELQTAAPTGFSPTSTVVAVTTVSVAVAVATVDIYACLITLRSLGCLKFLFFLPLSGLDYLTYALRTPIFCERLVLKLKL